MPPPVQVTVLESATSYDYLQKVIVMGDAHTGKTQCIQRMYENIYREDVYRPTIGVDFCLKCFKVNDKVIKMQVWDTAGDARFRSIAQAYYRGTSAIVMCYSVDDLESLPLSCDPIHLSGRETEVLELIAEGLTNTQVADKLFLSTHTITTHRKNIMSKLGVNNTAAMVMYAVKTGLVSPNKFLFQADS